MGNQVDVEEEKEMVGRKGKEEFCAVHAISTNGLEDLFPQSRASPSAQQSRASELPWWFSDTTQPLC